MSKMGVLGGELKEVAMQAGKQGFADFEKEFEHSVMNSGYLQGFGGSSHGSSYHNASLTNPSTF